MVDLVSKLKGIVRRWIRELDLVAAAVFIDHVSYHNVY